MAEYVVLIVGDADRWWTEHGRRAARRRLRRVRPVRRGARPARPPVTGWRRAARDDRRQADPAAAAAPSSDGPFAEVSRAGRRLLPGRDRRPRRPRSTAARSSRRSATPSRCAASSRRRSARMSRHLVLLPAPEAEWARLPAEEHEKGMRSHEQFHRDLREGGPPARRGRPADARRPSRGLAAARRLGRGARHRRAVHRVGRAGRRLLPRRDRRPGRPAAAVRASSPRAVS